MEELIIIQGDYYGLEVTFENIENELIESVVFSSQELGICKSFPYDNEIGAWLFELTSEETMAISKGHYTYDITVKLLDGKIMTAIYEYGLCIKEKGNKVECYE